MALQDQIDNNFKYHSPSEDQIPKYTAIRSCGKDFSELVNKSCPDCREKSLAITKIEEAVMWANAAIARNS